MTYWEVVGIAVAAVVAILMTLAVWVFLRALSTRLMTGKWPHQSEESKKIFDDLP